MAIKIDATREGLTVAGTVANDPLENSRREEFARLIVEGLNQQAAYRTVYKAHLDPATAADKVWSAASTLRNNPAVAKRIRFLKDEAARNTIISAAQLLQDHVDIANADPNELISNLKDCCRHCYGQDFAYEFESMDHYSRAVQANEALPPVMRVEVACGGFEYRPDREPNPCCPYCFGRGIDTQVLRDTTKLSAGARKLYKGVKITKTGIEVLMHDQQAARQEIAKILGVYRSQVELD
jgi:phage terminase small subunit